MNRLLLILFLFASLGSQAQDKFKDKFFIGFVSSYYIDFVSSPLSLIDVSRMIDDGAGGFIQTTDTAVPFQSRFLSFVSIGVEPRYNLLEFEDNMALALAMPATIGLGQSFEQNDDVLGARGFGNFQVPLMLKFYLGTNATYRSTDNFGFSAGAGFELNKVALVSTDDIQAIKDANKAWIMPVFSASLHFWRGNSPIEINFKYGRGELRSYNTNYTGFPLQDGERFTRANSIKLSFIYLLNY
ncbi:MAG: hypothetical protein JXR19_02460 [Bacteroidia bacterium]